MDQYTTLAAYRQRIYACFQHQRDALCDVVDAVATDDTARSFAELSLAPAFTRRWPSLYTALEDGDIDLPALRQVFASYVAPPAPGERLVLAADTSPYPRPEASTAEDRTMVYVATGAGHRVVVTPGWSYAAVVLTPPTPSSWVWVLDHRRVPSAQTATDVLVEQLTDLLPLLPARPLVDLDRGYAHDPFLTKTADLACDFLVRVPRTRVLYRPAPPRQPGQHGQTPLDGPRFQGSRPATHGPPDQTWTGTRLDGTPVEVQSWSNLHRKVQRHRPITMVRVYRPQAAGTKRDPLEAWYWWLADTPAPAPAIARQFAPARYSIEHGYRFRKQDLWWVTPRLRTPAEIDRWTALVDIVQNLLLLARNVVPAPRRPWEAPTRPATPRQVRRGLGLVLGQVGTPARPSQPRGHGRGRAKGAVVTPAPRYTVIRKPGRPAKRAGKRAGKRASHQARAPTKRSR